jgi:hypothetical protein
MVPAPRMTAGAGSRVWGRCRKSSGVAAGAYVRPVGERRILEHHEPWLRGPQQSAADLAPGVDLAQERSIGRHLPTIGERDLVRRGGRRPVGLVIDHQNFVRAHCQAVNLAEHRLIADHAGEGNLGAGARREQGGELRVV